MFGPSPVAVDSALPLGSGGWRWSATGADVYRCFFHGPAFQVIGRCALVDDQMWSEMSAAVMPLWSADTPDSQSDAHAIELGLQTAGLLELAMDRRMMIPKRIGRIAHGPGRLGPGSRAMARRASVSVATSSFTIDVVDSSGSPILVIHDYETQPLPFASDAHAVHTLAALLSTSPTAAP